MLCLKCTVDNQHAGPHCKQCGNWIGFVNDGRGFIPQLEWLENDLREENITVEECAERLDRLDQALNFMIQNIDKTGAALASLELDDTQQGVLSGFIMPAREGLESFKNLVANLDLSEEWSKEFWEQIGAAQFNILRGNEGMMFLSRNLMAFAAEAGMDLNEVGKAMNASQQATAPTEGGETEAGAEAEQTAQEA